MKLSLLAVLSNCLLSYFGDCLSYLSQDWCDNDLSVFKEVVKIRVTDKGNRYMYVHVHLYLETEE